MISLKTSNRELQQGQFYGYNQPPESQAGYSSAPSLQDLGGRIAIGRIAIGRIIIERNNTSAPEIRSVGNVVDEAIQLIAKRVLNHLSHVFKSFNNLSLMQKITVIVGIVSFAGFLGSTGLVVHGLYANFHFTHQSLMSNYFLKDLYQSKIAMEIVGGLLFLMVNLFGMIASFEVLNCGSIKHFGAPKRR